MARTREYLVHIILQICLHCVRNDELVLLGGVHGQVTVGAKVRVFDLVDEIRVQLVWHLIASLGNC